VVFYGTVTYEICACQELLCCLSRQDLCHQAAESACGPWYLGIGGSDGCASGVSHGTGLVTLWKRGATKKKLKKSFREQRGKMAFSVIFRE